MTYIDRPSPNHGARPAGVNPDLIIVHGSAGKSDEGDLSWIESSKSQVSYHYLIGRDGRVYRLVDEDRRAWHAGKSAWESRSDCNDYSIGIGLSNDGVEPFTHAQYVACGTLLADIVRRRHIPTSRIVGHYHVSPGRKTDPWYTFHWAKALGCMWAALDAPESTNDVMWVDGKRVP